MQRTGGILAIIAGVFGLLAAIVTVGMSNPGGALEAEGARVVIGIGRAGALFSSLCIILGAIVVRAKGRVPAFLLMFAAIGGAVFGGTLVAVPMLLAFVGGILGLFISREKTDA
ncbi:hypothetical protein [Ostreiculturibacter nitratireducens]|uniref:hypothetical protein n=1 Tax=Ostreiculturibacter nitratireducens TaxID=3075226 RepID=UPI0031B6154D